MTKSELTAMGLDAETAAKVAEKSAEEFKNYVSKDRFNELIEAKKGLEAQLSERDNQLKELGKAAGDNEALKKQIADLQTANKEADEAHKAQIRQLTLDHAIDGAMTAAKAKNLKAVRALLDMDAITLDETGKVSGIEKQLKKLAESDGYLFDAEKTTDGKPAANVAGMKPVTPAANPAASESIGAQMAKAYSAQFTSQANLKGE